MTDQNSPNAEIQKTLTKLMVEQERLSTVVARSIASQEQLNAHVQRLVEQHESRIRNLERSQAVTDARMPRRAVDADTFDRRMGEVENSVGSLSRRIAWFSGVGATLVFLVPLILQWLNK